MAVGGDAQISCGAEPSAMRQSANISESNFDRGYEHWLMAEARRRNPEIELLGLVYAWPSWIDPDGHSPYSSNDTEQNAADYMAAWVSGVKRSHNLTIQWVGLWNEQTVSRRNSRDVQTSPSLPVLRFLQRSKPFCCYPPPAFTAVHQDVRQDPTKNA